MIYITFRHSRDLFNKEYFKGWVYKAFGFNIEDKERPIKFEGCEYGNHYPQISMSISVFEKSKYKIPVSSLKKVTKIEGVFNILEQLSFGVCNFSNNCEDGELIDSIVTTSVYDFRNK